MGRQNGQHAYTLANVGFFIDFICKFGAILGLLGAILRPTWRHLDPMLDHVAAMLGVSCQSRFLCDVIDPNLSEVRFAR